MILRLKSSPNYSNDDMSDRIFPACDPSLVFPHSSTIIFTLVTQHFLDQCLSCWRRNLIGSPSRLPPPGELEEDSRLCLDPNYYARHNDYYGFTSCPISIYRTGDPWPIPRGPGSWTIARYARPIFDHPLATVWSEVGRQIYEELDSHDIKWTSIDPVHFDTEHDLGITPGPSAVFLWVGVIPGTLSRGKAQDAATRCKEILESSNLGDVEIAFRESVFTRLVGQQLHNHETLDDEIPDVRGPLTPALGLRIAPKAFPDSEGTGGLYICEGGESDRVFILTARHVLLPSRECANELYIYNGDERSRREVILCGNRAYEKVIRSTMVRAGNEVSNKGFSNIKDFERDGDYKVTHARRRVQALYKFYDQLMTSWSTLGQRVLGHVAYAPPISFDTGNQEYMEDWALIELHRDKIDWKEFKGNALDLGMFNISADYSRRVKEMSPGSFVSSLYPTVAILSGQEYYPLDDLFQLRDVGAKDELCQPTTTDKDGRPCFPVIKNGNATGVTFGQATGIESFVREYDEDYSIKSTFKAIAIHPRRYTFEHRCQAFSAPGDSGAIVADGNGRIIGMVVGGSGNRDLIDVTYLTPYYWIEERIREVLPNAHLYPATY